MSNYPPGVTGMEYQISGPSGEWDETRTVEHVCDEERFDDNYEGPVEGTVEQWGRDSRVFYWTCPQCGEDVEDEDEPEVPEAYED